ncbi:hypothetical protein ACTA71_006036 [Dictyostelium dimigraforme]
MSGGLGETYYEDIFLAEGKVIKDTAGNMYPFARTNTRFFKNTTTGKSGIKLGANEAIYDSNEQIYSTGGNGTISDPSTSNGITVDSTSKNVFIGTKPLDNSTQIDTHGVVFSLKGIHLTSDQNVYDSDGVPLNNAPLPLDTYGVTFDSTGVHLALGAPSSTLDTKGITFTDGGIVLGNSNQKFKKSDGTVIDNLDTKRITFTNGGVSIPYTKSISIGPNATVSSFGLSYTHPNSVFRLGSVSISSDGVALGPNQILYDRFGKEIKSMDTNGIQFTANGIVLNQGMKIYNQDMTLYDPITSPPKSFSM